MRTSGETLDRRRGTSVPNHLTCAAWAAIGIATTIVSSPVDDTARSQADADKSWGYSALFGFS